jgi:hypothetical protein
VTTYVVKPDKLGEYAAFIKKWLAWKKTRPDLFKEIKSLKFFSHWLGGNVGGYVEMWEMESLADGEKWSSRYSQDKERMTMLPEFMAIIVPGTYSLNIWRPTELQ